MALGTKLEEKICKEPIPDLMNACLFYGPRDIRYEKVQVPQIKDGEVLVKIDTALTCGTDLKTYFRGHPVLIQSIPSAFGHQFAGTIVQTGCNVKNFQAGQRIVAVNTAPCFTCRFCKKEKYKFNFRVILFEISDEIVIDRLKSRLICSNRQCQAIFSTKTQVKEGDKVSVTLEKNKLNITSGH